MFVTLLLAEIFSILANPTYVPNAVFDPFQFCGEVSSDKCDIFNINLLLRSVNDVPFSYLCSVVFWFGDLNFRIEDYDIHVVKCAIDSNKLPLLWERDQVRRFWVFTI